MVNQQDWRYRQFEQVIANLILDAVSRETVTFSGLVRKLPGVYPSLVLSTLRCLAESGQIDTGILFDVERQIVQDPPPYSERKHSISFPVPHPLDYDWRFTDESVDLLLEKCEQVSSEGQLVALLGTPTLMREAVERSKLEGAYRRRMNLFDADDGIIRSFEGHVERDMVIHREIGIDSLPDIQASVVIADPPWYEEYLDPFLYAASHLCVVGGYLILAIPPRGTRSGISEEQDRLQTHAKQRGFKWSVPERGRIRYTTPLFERNSLLQSGIRNVPADWRSGDLVLLQLSERRIPSYVPKLPPRIAWTEYVIDGVRIRVYPGEDDGVVDPCLKSLVRGDVLPSVSRRENTRSQVRVWTSGNRVYGCEGLPALRAILSTLSDAGNADGIQDMQSTSAYQAVSQVVGRDLSFVEMALIDGCVSQIRELVACESEEARQLACEALPT